MVACRSAVSESGHSVSKVCWTGAPYTVHCGREPMFRLHRGTGRLQVYSVLDSLLTIRIVISVRNLLRLGSFDNAFHIHSTVLSRECLQAFC
jgi:hypothetical protein